MPALSSVQAQSQQGDRHRDETNEDHIMTHLLLIEWDLRVCLTPLCCLIMQPYTLSHWHHSIFTGLLCECTLWQRADENVHFCGRKERRETWRLDEPVKFLLSNSSIT